MANPNNQDTLVADSNGHGMLSDQQALVADVATNVAAGDVGTAADIATEINVSRTAINDILAILSAHGLMADA